MPLRYALNLPNAGIASAAPVLAEFAAVAEDSGWDAVFLEDYVVYQAQSDVPVTDPWIALAAMATRTSRIRLGTMVTPLARRRPWSVAKAAATIDHLSGGRFVLGVGLGDSAADLSFTGFGEENDIRRRAKMVDESLQIIASLWTGETTSFIGEHYRIQNVRMLPTPVQAPRIPIWIGGAFPHRGAMLRAAKWDGANLFRAKTSDSPFVRGLTIEEFIELRGFVTTHRKGQPGPFELFVHPRLSAPIAEERDRLTAFAAAGATWSQVWFPPDSVEAMRQRIAAGPLRVERI